MRSSIIIILLILTGLLLSQCTSSSETTEPEAVPKQAPEREDPLIMMEEDPGITALRDIIDGTVLTRSDWGAEDAVLPLTPHEPRHVTIHHTAVMQNWERSLSDKIRALQDFSQKETELWDGRIKDVWADIPYHYYIAWDGAIAEARDVRFQGDSNTDYDLDGKIQIVLEGNFQEEIVTDEQYTSLVQLTGYLMHQWDIPVDSLSTHRDHTETLCPGLDLTDKMEWLRHDLAFSDANDGIFPIPVHIDQDRDE